MDLIGSGCMAAAALAAAPPAWRRWRLGLLRGIDRAELHEDLVEQLLRLLYRCRRAGHHAVQRGEVLVDHGLERRPLGCPGGSGHLAHQGRQLLLGLVELLVDLADHGTAAHLLFGWKGQLRLARDCPQIGREWRIGRRQQARYGHAAVDAAQLDQTHVGDELVPGLDVLLQVQPAHPLVDLGRHRQRLRRRVLGRARGRLDAQHPALLVGELAHHAAGRVPEPLVVAVAGEQARHPFGQGLAAGALEDLQRVRPGGTGDRELRVVAAHAGALQAAEDAELQREGHQHLAHAGHELLVHGRHGRRRAARQRRLQVIAESGPLLRREHIGQVGIPVDADPGPQRLGIEAVGRVEHQVALERLVGELEVVAAGRAQPLLEPLGDTRQQRLVQQLAVAQLRAGLDVAALVQAQAVGQRRVLDVEAGRARRVVQQVQHLRQQGHVAAAAGGRQGVDRLADLRQLGLDLAQVGLVAHVAQRPAGRHGDRQRRDGGHGGEAQPAPPRLGGTVDADQPRSANTTSLQQACEEVALARAARRWKPPCARAEGTCQRAHDAVDRACLPACRW
jgi:hypothetical protein